MGWFGRRGREPDPQVRTFLTNHLFTDVPVLFTDDLLHMLLHLPCSSVSARTAAPSVKYNRGRCIWLAGLLHVGARPRFCVPATPRCLFTGTIPQGCRGPNKRGLTRFLNNFLERRNLWRPPPRHGLPWHGSTWRPPRAARAPVIQLGLWLGVHGDGAPCTGSGASRVLTEGAEQAGAHDDHVDRRPGLPDACVRRPIPLLHEDGGGRLLVQKQGVLQGHARRGHSARDGPLQQGRGAPARHRASHGQPERAGRAAARPAAEYGHDTRRPTVFVQFELDRSRLQRRLGLRGSLRAACGL